MSDIKDLAGTWDIDPAHTRIGFASRHAMVTKVRGAFNDVNGTAYVDGEDLGASKIEVHVRLDSVDTRNTQRDEHLRSPDFFDVATHPVMVFTAEGIDEVEEGHFIIAGELAIRAIIKPLTIPLSLMGVERDPTGTLRAGLEGTRRIDRKDWGITWNTALDSGGVLVSDKITLEFELSLIKREDD